MFEIEVAYSPKAGVLDRVALQLPDAATVADALGASGLLARHGLELAQLRVGIWGRACEPATLLRQHDRVEIYRALQVDPKEARRLRYQRHRDSVAARKAAGRT